jgi:hypothetical protein
MKPAPLRAAEQGTQLGIQGTGHQASGTGEKALRQDAIWFFILLSGGFSLALFARPPGSIRAFLSGRRGM